MDLILDQTYTYQGDIHIKWTRFGSGKPLVFCHGTPWSTQLWAPFARSLAKYYEVYLYDMPGYGQSIMPVATDLQPTYPFQAEVFSALFTHWSTAVEHSDFQPHVVAHDIGGHVALRAHLMEGLPFSSLLILDCGASVAVDEAFFSLVRENPSTFIRLPSSLHEALLRAYIRSASYKGLNERDEDTLVQPWLTADGQKAFYNQIAAQRNSDIDELRRHFRKLTVPLRILWGREDAWVPFERAESLQQLIGGTVCIIEDAGHLIQIDASELVMAELFEWLVRDEFLLKH